MKTSTSAANFLRKLLAPLCAAILPALLATSANAQDIVAGWDFQTTTTGGTAVLASPSTPTVFNANVGNGTLYLNGAEGSSSWAAATELNGFTGTAINASNGLATTTTSPAALAVLGGTGNAANGKSVSFKFSMAGKKDLQISFAAQRSGTGFNSQVWEYSTNATAWSSIGTLSGGTTPGTIRDTFNNTGILTLPTVTGLDGAATAYVRVTFSGATASSGNNRLDNFRFMASAVGTGPIITSFSPPTGVIGDTVTINGSNFGATPGVKFNGIAAFSTVNGAGTVITATVPSGATTGKITVEVAGETTATSATDFTVVEPNTPIITLSTNAVSGLNTLTGVASAATNYVVTGTNLGVTPITVTPSSALLEIGTNGTDFTNSLSLPAVGGVLSNNVFLRVAATNGVTNYNATISHVSGSASNSLAVGGAITNLPPVLAVSTNTLSGFTTTTNVASTAQTFTVTGSNLTTNVTVGAPTGFQVANDGTTWGTNTSLTPISGSVSNTISVRLGASSVSGFFSGNVTVASTGATTRNVAASGVVSAPTVFITLSNTNTGSYTQNFDSLGTGTISNSISATAGVQTSLGGAVTNALDGWYAAKIAGTGTSATGIVADNGTNSSGGIYNYGSTANSDRSLGALSSGSTIPGFGALIKNETGQTLEGVQISFTAKFWRSTTNNNTLTFGYGLVDGSNFTTTNFLTASNASALTAADVVYPAGTNNAALDGNLPANQIALNNLTITQAVAPGATLFIRWQDANDAGNDAGLAIDNVSLTALGSAAAPIPPTITSTNAFSGTVGVAFSNDVTATGDAPIGLSGTALPGGLSVASSGAITGTPTAAGTFNATLTATNAAGTTNQAVTFTIAKGAVSIISAPTATGLVQGQTLDLSTLTGGSASVAGTFAWTDSSIIPPLGTTSYGVTFTPTDAANYNTAATTASVTVISTYQAGYNNWLTNYPSLTGANTNGTADPDSDGFNNNSEYAFGTSPIVPNGALLSTTTSNSVFRSSWAGPASGVTYGVFSTTNLATTAFTNDPTAPVLTNGNVLSFTNQATGNKFFRVRATSN